jgi:peptidoglycan hydrolase-like protein with peptidoglycan-binding domain
MKTFNLKFLTATTLALAVVVVPSFASAEMLYRQLEVGSRGTDVSSLQSFLASDATIYPSGLVTGYFGLMTKSGVMRFQSRNGISQVGRVGPQTLAAINAQMGGVGSNNSPFVEAAPGFTGLSAVSVNGLTAQVSVSTNVATRATLYYSPSPIVAFENSATTPITVTIGGEAVQSNTNLQTSHTIATQTLLPNTTYYAMILVTDSNGVVSVIRPASFRTN